MFRAVQTLGRVPTCGAANRSSASQPSRQNRRFGSEFPPSLDSRLRPGSPRFVCWWSLPAVVASLGITKEQSADIERLYQASLPARSHASLEVAHVLEKVTRMVEAGEDHDQLLRVTEELARARQTECALRHQVLKLTSGALLPEQREQPMGSSPNTASRNDRYEEFDWARPRRARGQRNQDEPA